MKTKSRKGLISSSIILIIMASITGCQAFEKPTSSVDDQTHSKSQKNLDNTDHKENKDTLKQESEYDDKGNYKPHQRTLTKTMSFIGEKTIYNTANFERYDKCDWDYNSDGSIDLRNDCGTISYIHTDKEAKMSVTITDSLGEKYYLTSEDTAFDKSSMFKD